MTYFRPKCKQIQFAATLFVHGKCTAFVLANDLIDPDPYLPDEIFYDLYTGVDILSHI